MKKNKLQQSTLKLNKGSIADLQSETIFGGVRGVGNIPTNICITGSCPIYTTSYIACPGPTDPIS